MDAWSIAGLVGIVGIVSAAGGFLGTVFRSGKAIAALEARVQQQAEALTRLRADHESALGKVEARAAALEKTQNEAGTFLARLDEKANQMLGELKDLRRFFMAANRRGDEST